MSGWLAWLTVIGAAAVTLAIRASFIVLPPHTRLPAWLLECLKYVGAAVLPALILPEVLMRDVPAGDLFNWVRVAAALAAMLFALRTRSVFGTLLVGMAVLWLLKWWLGAG